MDPNEALRNILRGYEVEEHIEALKEWLAKGGFRPEIDLPHDAMGVFTEAYSLIMKEGHLVRMSADSEGILDFNENDGWSLVVEYDDIPSFIKMIRKEMQ